MNLYLEWHVVKSMVSYLSKPFRNAKKEFSEVLSGELLLVTYNAGYGHWTERFILALY